MWWSSPSHTASPTWTRYLITLLSDRGTGEWITCPGSVRDSVVTGSITYTLSAEPQTSHYSATSGVSKLNAVRIHRKSQTLESLVLCPDDCPVVAWSSPPPKKTVHCSVPSLGSLAELRQCQSNGICINSGSQNILEPLRQNNLPIPIGGLPCQFW